MGLNYSYNSHSSTPIAENRTDITASTTTSELERFCKAATQISQRNECYKFINFDTATQRAYCRLFLTYPHIHDQRFKIRMKDFAIRNDKGPIAFYRHFLTSQALSAQFFGIQLVVIFMMTIAVSKAGVERIFSIMNLIKTSRRYQC